MDEDTERELNEFMLTHAVLPRRLPEQKPTYTQQLSMLNKMIANIDSVKECIPQKTRDFFQRFQQLHKSGTSIRAQTINDQIKELHPGDTFAMFVRHQNCTVMVHRMENNNDDYNVVVATFPGDLQFSEVYKYESDIEFHYPNQAIKVKFSDILKSPEFAEQLSVLHEDTPFRSKKRNYVTKWLVSLLSDEGSSPAASYEFPVIAKKVRAELVGDIKDEHFRRSRVYMIMKVLQQHSLTMHLGNELGKFLYKIIMLKFFVQICVPYADKNCNPFRIDLLSQTIAKMARRIDKLESQPKPDSVTSNIESLYTNVISKAKQSIQKIRSNIDKQIRIIQFDAKEEAQLPELKGLNFEKAVRQKLKKYRTQMLEQEETNEDVEMRPNYEVKSYERFFVRYFPSVDVLANTKSELEWGIFWTDFENWILYKVTLNDEHMNPNVIRKWFSDYSKRTEVKYKDNQLLTSRMILVRLKLIAILDNIVIKKYPMLREHKSGINPNMINTLLLPQLNDMKIAYDLEKYFANRNLNADDPSLIEEKWASQRSFATKFANEDAKMEEIRQNIKQLDDKNVELKRTEYLNMHEDYNRAISEMYTLICVNQNRKTGCYANGCERCAKERESQRKEIDEYKRLLPSDEHEQRAIVFELLIPNAIACLRDVLFGFIRFCTGNGENLDIKSTWIDCSEFEEYLPSNAPPDYDVKLGSTIRNFVAKKHVSQPFDSFIVDNRANCTYYGVPSGVVNEVCKAMPATVSDNAVKPVCKFKGQDEYQCLQWTMDSTSHYQNQVLTRYLECPQSLSLSEYKNFGSLRADGHRIQLWKLYAMIETEALSFEKESVLALIMQTLWECGIAGIANEIRESHFEFTVPDFCSAMIKLLLQFNKQQKDNWVHPFKLLMTTLIAVRAFEINQTDAVADLIVQLLINIRETALNWIDQIEMAIRDLSPPNEQVERELRLKLIYVAITGGLTFFVHPQHQYFLKIFAPTNAMASTRIWLQFIITLKNNIRMYTNDEEHLPSNVRMFLRLIEMVGVHIEATVRAKIDQKRDSLEDLVKKQWPRCEHGTFQSYDFHTDYPHIFIANVHVDEVLQKVTIDIITGAFLVDGLPLSRLPPEIVQSDMYKWFFGDVAFEVQPDAQNNFSTIQKYNGCTYHFKKEKDKDVVKIFEQNCDDIQKELLDHKLFVDDLPHLLVMNYCHWFDKDENCIEFRPRLSEQKHFSSAIDIEYRLNLDTDRLIQVKTRRVLIDIKSKTYRRIVKQLERLEKSKYIHVFVQQKLSKKEAHIELVRMNLKFNIENVLRRTTYDLESNEFSEMRISRRQNIGTLYGLKHGLVLEKSTDKSTRILLMPNGHIQSERTNSHVSVEIEVRKDVRKPPFFQYQVDGFCKQLKASNSSHASWFYLAYLHAVTSHGQTEPFTGMSGTERALQILQSSFAWSSSPYEPEALELLNEIAKLSPIRKKSEAHSQIVNWPKDISSHSAQDSFVFIAKKLIEDSQRLHLLYFKESAQLYHSKSDLNLNEREYRRCLQLQPNVRVNDSFIEAKKLKATLPDSNPITFSPDTQNVAILFHRNEYQVNERINLKAFLTGKRARLDGMAGESVQDFLRHKVTDSFADLWIGLYEVARKQHFEMKLNDIELVMVLSLLAHLKEETDPIYALQAVARNPRAFEHLEPPLVTQYRLSEGTFNKEKLVSLLQHYRIKPDNYYELSEQKRKTNDTIFTTVTDDLTSITKACWDKFIDKVDFSNKWSTHIDIRRANTAVNQKYTFWLSNQKLYRFIRLVEQKLRSLPESENSIHLPVLTMPAMNMRHRLDFKHEIDIDQLIRERLNEMIDSVNEAHEEWNMNKRNHRTADYWWNEIENVLVSDRSHHLIHAGLFPRMVPSLLMPKLMDINTDNRLKSLIGAWALDIAREQRKKRIDLSRNRPELRAIWQSEMDNKPHVNWKPCERPEWLIFEIERNLTIRRIQIEIAKRMIEPPTTNAKHSVMQLNMGEGKTDVIVPISAAILANGQQICQITVLKPLFARNLKSLRQYLGGMLNRKIYTFPCRRDMAIAKHINENAVMEIYEECKEIKGVILTLPDYRLSFQLKLYESIQKEDFEAAKSILHLQRWINANVRNILDESDAILQANYQLVYTVGNQLSLDGGSQRWFIAQAVLKRVPYHMKRLYEIYGHEKIEFDDKYVENGHVYGTPHVRYRPDIFTPCRILDESIFDELKLALVDDFLDGLMDIDFRNVVSSERSELKQVISEKEPTQRSFEIVERLSLNERNTVWILSGLLRFEVLKLALTKRWRVNYGVDPRGQRKMAIPFKAKDIAAEMTEFGHPDVAICFTQMSYYYSGLTDVQLRKLFNILENKQNASNIYEKWIASVPQSLVEPTIEKYSGVNMDDPKQRDQLLFPLLRYNMHAIDFWLADTVFPHEAKVFERKLMCTAWDLCSDHLQHRVTGFSGTNDTKNILPLPIAQNDLNELQNTNDEMRAVLLRQQRRSHDDDVRLPANISGKQILERLVKRDIPVLLDSGALMLELTNEQVATEWLKMTSDVNFDAAVYFDSRDVLQTIDRNGSVTEFDGSVYRDNLSRCLVYLDDVHTRGTDLKFPLDWTACVTLSGDITRDKTVQSCMRMRQLGKSPEQGHSIWFLPSYEAEIRIRKLCQLTENDRVTSKHVIEFIEENSRQFERSNMVHWAAAALNYTKKFSAHEKLKNSCDREKLDELYDTCVDDEFVDLDQMYGDKEEADLTKITYKKFDNFAYEHRLNRDFIRKMQDDVEDKLREYAKGVKRFSHALNEEQQKELEQEQEFEEERQMERPPNVKAAIPAYDQRLKQIIAHGITDDNIHEMKQDRALFSMVSSLSNTQLMRICRNNDDAWSNHLLVTSDFKKVSDSISQACDAFLRPVWWIARIKNFTSDKDALILLSSFECNQLLSTFRSSECAILHMFRPRLSKNHSNLLHQTEIQLTGMRERIPIAIEDEVQISMFAGTMYFKCDAEQNAYCSFMGLIPRPRPSQLEIAFDNRIIESKGYVPIEKRGLAMVAEYVSQCRFKVNPVDLAIKLIEAHHQTLLKESHVASIFGRGVKKVIVKQETEE